MRRRAFLSGAASSIAASITPAQAQADYPSRSITIIVAVAPGSPTDVFARLLGSELSARLGQPVVIENRPGGGQVVGASAAARAAPDGYTLFHGNVSGLIISPQLRQPPPYNSTRDFQPISTTFSGPQALLVSPTLPVRSVGEFIAYAKANPGRLNYGSYGVGSYNHVTTELLKGIAGIDVLHVPYSGGSTLTTALLTGEIQMLILDLGLAHPLAQSGRARVVAQVGDRRSELYPDVPLLSEAVDPALATDLWLGLVAPTQTSPAIVARLNRELAEVLRSPLVRARGEQAALSPSHTSPEAFAQKIRSEWERWGKVLRDRNITLN